MKKKNITIKLIFLYFTILHLSGCASHLSVAVIDSESGILLDDVTVEATPDGIVAPQKIPTSAGVAVFKNIKKAPVTIVIPKSESHFSKTLTLERGADLKNVEIKLDSLQTILYGKVLDTLGRGIEGCLVRTEPMTDTLRTDSDGLYTLKSKQFVEMYYDVVATHKDYKMNRRSNVFIQPDNEHWIQPIKLESVEGFEADSLGPEIEDAGIGGDDVWLDPY